MVDTHRAIRQFERMFPKVVHQEHLRATDPQRYNKHLRSHPSQPIDLRNSRLISTIVYNPQNETVRVERVAS